MVVLAATASFHALSSEIFTDVTNAVQCGLLTELLSESLTEVKLTEVGNMAHI
jgi:hypothetical protein